MGIGFLNRTNTTLITEPGYSPAIFMEGKSIPLLKPKRSALSIKNVGVDIIDYARSASYEVIVPRSVGFLKLSIPANKDLVGKDVCF